MKLSWKIFTFTFLIAALTLSLVGAHTVDRIVGILIDHTLSSVQGHAGREAKVLENHFRDAMSDTLLLASTYAARELPATQSEAGRLAIIGEMQATFMTLLREKPAYTQVRLICREGKELVRVNQVGGIIDVVTEDRLQDKSNRYYFKETIDMPPGELFVSAVDLNREEGKIVVPHQPVVRIATPVASTGGTVVGILVINLDLNTLLDEIASPEEGGILVVTNEQGDYLYHPDNSLTFGFEFGHENRLPGEYRLVPQWNRWMQSVDRPAAVKFATDTSIIALQKIFLTGDLAFGPDRTLALGVIVPQAILHGEGDLMQRHFQIMMVIICGLLAAALGAVTAYITRPIRVLTEAANRIASGEHGVPVPTGGNDEIGILAQDFDAMVTALKDSARTKELAALGRMSAMVAHDLRNALSSVKMNLQILEQDGDPGDHSQAQKYDISLRQVSYMEDILQDLLSFARSEAPRADWHEMAEIVQTATVTLLPLAAEKGGSFVTRNLETLPRVRCDRTKMIQVFQNLVDNALDAQSEGGEVIISGQLVPGADGPEVRIDVADQGAGIPNDIRPQLFEPFFTTRTKGTGLGLAIVKRIVEDHDGRVELFSRIGMGTTITVVLPVAGPGASEPTL
ncbi:sensor histidine kinase [Magnetospira sp. QH-2]|uniref:sensor histidine kinase n=1 Tax=Magnetospira sp. (strain QH-2) TaxID=1288970 RepID=UPI0003E81180|nr:sensor histidine kinase [Magnetospira sp. QH-2]CCQ75089.1 putative histidine kinase [Magnetospira sp. QH-2]